MQELDFTDMKPTSYTMTTANCAELKHGHEVQLDYESLDGDAKFRLDNVMTKAIFPFHHDRWQKMRIFSDGLICVKLASPDKGDGRVTILIGRPD